MNNALCDVLVSANPFDEKELHAFLSYKKEYVDDAIISEKLRHVEYLLEHDLPFERDLGKMPLPDHRPIITKFKAIYEETFHNNIKGSVDE